MRVQIDPSGQWGWDEYALPCKFTDLPSTEGLTPWMKRWIGRDAAEIIGTLSMEWASIRYPSVARFRDVLLKFRPFALAQDGTQWYLGLNRRDEDEDRDGTVYIEAPLHPVVLEKCLANQDLAGFDLIREFYTHFHGVRERPVSAGNFERPEEWQPFRALGWEEDDFEPEFRPMIREWFDALILHTTLGGDMVLRKADDQTAWILHEEHRITALAPSFSGFLELCSESYDKYFCLDYYLLN